MHGLAIIIIIIVRVLLANKNGGGTTIGWPRLSDRPRRVSLFVRTGLVGLAFALWSHSRPWALLCLLLVIPELLVGYVLVPAGVPNLTYYFTRIVRPHSVCEESAGGAVFHELRARLRWGLGFAQYSMAVLAAKLFDSSTDRSVRGATIAARAMLDAVNGDAQSARSLFNVGQDLRGLHAPRAARVYCQSWLLADAARRGAYNQVIRLATRGPTTFRRAFFRACSERLIGAPRRLPDVALVFLWLLSPARRTNLHLLQNALRAERRTEIEPIGSGLKAATLAATRLLRLPRGIATRDELRSVAEAWQTVFESDELRAHFTSRRAALEANVSVDALLARCEQDLTELLAELWRDALADDRTDEQEPDLIVSAKDALQVELLDEIDQLCDLLPTDEREQSADFDQRWRAWAAVRDVAQTFLDTLPDRRHLLYESVEASLLNHGAWLHNRQKAALLAHDIFRWLLRLHPPDDGPNLTTLKNNVRLGRWA